MSAKSDTLEIRMVWHFTSDRAVKVSQTPGSAAIWLPLAEIEMSPIVTSKGVRYVDLTIPQWLAEEKRLA